MGRDIVRQNTTELSLVQVSAVAALAGGASVTEAASRAKVDRTTVHRWLAEDPEFLAAGNRPKAERLEAIRAEVRAGAAEAIKAVREILRGKYYAPAVQLRAAL